MRSFVAGLLLVMLLAPAAPARAQTSPIRVAVTTSLTGQEHALGGGIRDGAQLAIDDANSDGGAPVAMHFIDDRSSVPGARAALQAAIDTGDLVVVGPVLTAVAARVGPAYARAGLVSILPTAHGDALTRNATTFRTIFSGSEMGAALANYVRYALGRTSAVMLYNDNPYGRPLHAGFARAATRAGLRVSAYPYRTLAESASLAQAAARHFGDTPLIIGGIDLDAVSIITNWRRGGGGRTILGTTAIADPAFPRHFAALPETRAHPGFFTDGLLAPSPMLLDSANAATLAFAARFRLRFGYEPPYFAAQAYDATHLAVAAARAASADAAAASLAQRREAVRDWLVHLDGPAHAIGGVLGPLWFTPERGREQDVRIARFHDDALESAPLQLVPVRHVDAGDVASGAVVDLGNGAYLRRQRVVFTGLFLNQVSRIDLAQSQFSADFYVWVRYAKAAWHDTFDPADIVFPDLTHGAFDPAKLAAASDLSDGTSYRLWHVRGDFQNAYDLHRFPMDAQTLTIRYFNAVAASDRVVYADDREAPALRNAAPNAFEPLTQWRPQAVERARELLVTPSALGDPRLVGLERQRELSGFRVDVHVARRTAATLLKDLLPLGLMTLIMFASLFFPPTLVKEKVTVAVTAALSGAVLLSAINARLGSVGYTILLEYAFFVFFALSLLCIVSVLAAERLRAVKRDAVAARTERYTRGAFAATMLIVALAGWWSAASGAA